jgi:hypothetical protein
MGSRGIALLFSTSALERGGWSAPRTGRFTLGKDPVPIVQAAGWAPGPVWTCAKNFAPTEIRSPDRPARSQSLHGLSYPAQYYRQVCYIIYPVSNAAITQNCTKMRNLEHYLLIFLFKLGTDRILSISVAEYPSRSTAWKSPG